jgi:hypothetical protein
MSLIEIPELIDEQFMEENDDTSQFMNTVGALVESRQSSKKTVKQTPHQTKIAKKTSNPTPSKSKKKGVVVIRPEDNIIQTMKTKFNEHKLPYKLVSLEKIGDRVVHCCKFLSLTDVVPLDELYHELCQVVEYSRPKLYGTPIPRSMAWVYFSDASSSGTEAEIWSQKEFALQPQIVDSHDTKLGQVAGKLGEFTGTRWNRCLIVRLCHDYDKHGPGQEKLGKKYHTGFQIGEDNVNSLVLQVGQQRKFIVRPKHCRKVPEFFMNSGDLVYMNQFVNKNCTHEIPADEDLIQCDLDSFFITFYQ